MNTTHVLGLIADVVGGVWGQVLDCFGGFSNNFEKSKIQKLKIDQIAFKNGGPSASRRPQGSKIREKIYYCTKPHPPHLKKSKIR